MLAPQPAYTILRIKRPLTQDPLDSLLIEDAPRAKRRRETGNVPLGGGKGVFRLVESVGAEWEEGEGGEALRLKISRLVAAKETGSTDPANFSTRSHASPLDSALASSSVSTRYRVLHPMPRRSLTRPPVVQEAPEPGAPPPFKMIDALPVPLSHVPVPSSSSAAGQSSGNRILESEEDDPEVAAFLPMLREYLAVSNPPPSSSSSASTPAPEPDQGPEPTEEQFVYDLYYKDVSASNASVPTASGTVEGYFGEDEELLPESDDSESDEVDEDSNDEDFYRNDYPEDQDSDDSGGDGIGSSDERWEEDY